INAFSADAVRSLFVRRLPSRRSVAIGPTTRLPLGTPRRRGYRRLLGILAVQAFGNQMAASFWLVYLVSPRQSLSFDVSIFVWLIGFAVAACTVLGLARGLPLRAPTAM